MPDHLKPPTTTGGSPAHFATASELMRTVSGRHAGLAGALAELGRLVKTLYLLAYLDEEPYRRRILRYLNRQESRHTLARNLFHGDKGELRQRYREGQEDQLSALGLVVNVIALWNTVYLQRALDDIASAGLPVVADDIARITPLGHEHVNFRGRYAISPATTPALGTLRPLRRPA